MRLVLTICGTTLEVLGLVFVVAEATRARRDEYGDLSPHLRVYRWLRRAFLHDEPTPAPEPERRVPDKFEIALALAEPQALKSQMDAEAAQRSVGGRAALRREVNGAYVFMFGAILSCVANLV